MEAKGVRLQNKPTDPTARRRSKQTRGEGLDFGNRRSAFGLKPKRTNPHFEKGGVKKNTIFFFVA